MEEIGGVHVLYAFQGLVDYVPFVNVFQYIGSDDSMEISVHVVEYQVDVFVVFGSVDVKNSNYVFMAAEFLKKYDFSKCSLSVGSVLEGVKVLLECYNLFGFFIYSFPHDSVSTFT